VWIVHKQREHLGNKAELLIDELNSLYRLGVSLNIFTADLDFEQLLLTLHTSVNLL
jgi:hypothetical protein